jgi:hypothetical protein
MTIQRRDIAQGPFGSFGVPAGVTNRQEFELHKRKEQVGLFNERLAEMSANIPVQDRNMFNMFAKIGNAIGGKFDKQSPLTAKEERQVSIMEATNEQVANLSRDPEFRKLDPVQQSFRMQQIMADAAFDAGDITGWSAAVQDLGRRMGDYRYQQAQLQKLEMENATTEKDIELKDEIRDVSLDELRSGSSVPMVPVVGGQIQVGTVGTVKRMPNGTYVDAATGEALMPGRDFLLSEDAARISAMQDASVTASGKTALTYKDIQKDYGLKRMNVLRDGLSDIKQLEGIVGELSDTFVESPNPADIVGNPGTFNNFANNVIKTVTGGARTAGFFKDVDEDGNGSGKFRTLTEAADDYIDDSMLPLGLAAASEGAARYKASIMQMVYADARLNEPGARQLSDADIRHAMERLGVNSSDAATVLKVFSESVDQRLALQLEKYQYFENTMAFATGDVKENMGRTFGTDPVARVEQARARIRTSFDAARAALGGAPTPVLNVETGELNGLTPSDAAILSDILNR